MLDDYAIVAKRHTTFVMVVEDEVIGVLVVVQTKPDMLLDNVAVHPEYPGKGLGRRLLALAESETRDQGCR